MGEQTSSCWGTDCSGANFSQSLYEASLQALTERGVPVSAAKRASRVVASDDASLPNFGRTPQDQKDVNDAMTWFHAERVDDETLG